MWKREVRGYIVALFLPLVGETFEIITISMLSTIEL